MDVMSFDSLQSLLDAFVQLSQKLPTGLTDGTIKAIDYSQVKPADVLPLALAEIRQVMAQAGIEAPEQDDALSLSGRVPWVMEHYPLSMPLAALAKHHPGHPVVRLNAQDKRDFSVFVQSFCDAVGAPEVDLNDPNDRRMMAPLFTMGCAFLGLGQAFGLQGTTEVQVMQHMLAAMHQAGVLEP